MLVNNNSNQNFGMAFKFSSEVNIPYSQNSKSIDKLKRVLNIIKKQDGNQNDIFVYQNAKGKLEAKVGQKIYKEGLFTSPEKVIENSAKHADSLQKREINLIVDKNDDYSHLIQREYPSSPSEYSSLGESQGSATVIYGE